MKRDKTTDDICEILDIDESTLKRWVGMGLPCTRGGKRVPRQFNEGEVVAWMRANKLTGKPGRPLSEGGKDLQAAKLRKENAMARKYELENARTEGELLDRGEVEQQRVQRVVALRGGLLTLPASLAPALEGRSAAEIEAAIEAAVERLLTQFAKE